MSDLVYLKNLMTDPRCTRKRNVWSNISGTTVHQRDDGLYQYNGPSDGVLSIFVWGSNSTVPTVQDVSVGDVVFAKFTPVDDFRDVESATIVLSGDGWVAARRNILTNLSLRFSNGASVTLERCAHYTPETWEKVREMYETGSLELPYFDYKTMPLGGGVFVLALSLLVLSALNGGWRHDVYNESRVGSAMFEEERSLDECGWWRQREHQCCSGREDRIVDVHGEELVQPVRVPRHGYRFREGFDRGRPVERHDSGQRRGIRGDCGERRRLDRRRLFGDRQLDSRHEEQHHGDADGQCRVHSRGLAARQGHGGIRRSSDAMVLVGHDAHHERLMLGVVA